MARASKSTSGSAKRWYLGGFGFGHDAESSTKAVDHDSDPTASAGARHAPSTVQAFLRSLLLQLYLPCFFINGGTAMLVPLLPLYLDDVGLSDSALGLVIGGARRRRNGVPGRLGPTDRPARQTFFTLMTDPVSRGKAMALFNGMFNVGYATGVFGLGLLAKRAGYPPVFAVGAGAAFAALVILATSRPRSQPPLPARPPK